MSGSDSKQARISLAASENAVPAQASETGIVAPSQILTVSVITRRRNPLSLASLGGRILTHSEFNEQYAADPADFEALRSFAHDHGLSVDEGASSLARRTLMLRGPASRMEHAFGITLRTFRHAEGAREFWSYSGALSIPEAHAPIMEAVLGLDTRPIAKSYLRRAPDAGDGGRIIRAAATGPSFTPVEVARLYDFPTGVTGAGQTIGLLELGGGYEASDITAYFKSLGLPAPAVIAVSVDGGTNVPGGDPNGADGEVALDIQVAGAVAPGAKIAVYFAPNTDQGFIDTITTAVHDTANRPSVLSISWGGPESGWSAASRTALDNACQSASALGITVTVASGDNGSSDGGTGNNVDFPASSPHVLACGGTKLEGSGAAISSEVVWNDQPSGGGATGGGVSTAFPLPEWQASANVPGGKGRGVPDVAGDASPESGYSVLVDGAKQVVGGTSAVAPLWAGLVTLINQQRAAAGKATVGFINPTLYAAPSALRDIAGGSNGTFNAAPGWDACTGLGSPKGTAVAAALSAAATAPVNSPVPAPPKPKPTKKHKYGRS